ncbi:MAG: PEP/pyruvate-binding domain-containing protein, partial [bacterium]
TEDLAGALKTAYHTLTANTSRGIAVRSSANVEDRLEHSFAGQFETVLNITNWDDLVTAFKRVLASNFNARCISYRQQVGLPVVDFDMAVLCLMMIPAKAAGVLFTMDPGSRDTGRMLISAVPGLGTSAVDGEFATDLFYPSRTGPKPDDEVKTAEKHKIVVCHPDGGIEEQTLDPSQSRTPLLNVSQLQTLVNMGLMVESLSGQAQDIEWAVSPDDEISILQARPLHLPVQIGRMVESLKGKPLVSGGAIACSGRVAGRVQIIRSLTDFEHPGQGPRIMVLHQSMVDAARWISDFSGVIVDIGNPGDHLSCVARENGRPMLTGTENATKVLHDGQLIVLDTDRHLVFEAPESIWGEVEHSWRTAQTGQNPKARPFKQAAESREVESLRKLIVPLNLTDAYGPTFSILECQSIHDIIRYIHEMGILTMFEASDRVLFGGGDRYRLETEIPFYFQIIDLGGGIISSRKGLKITLDDVVSAPFLALWEGVSTPGLRWSGPPPHGNVSGLISRSMLDGRSARPVGSMNYVLLAFDYINLNARMDYHFAMLDSVCSTHNRDNYIRFRFKGGGTSQVQRERRTAFIATVLSENDFFTATIGDMVTGTLTGTSKETIREKLIMIGRLLGFSRLMDAAMTDDSAPVRLSRAFLEGDYTLEQFSLEKSADPGDSFP